MFCIQPQLCYSADTISVCKHNASLLCNYTVWEWWISAFCSINLCLHSVAMLEVFIDYWDEELNVLHCHPHWCGQHGCLDLFTADRHVPPQPSGLFYGSGGFAGKGRYGFLGVTYFSWQAPGQSQTSCGACSVRGVNFFHRAVIDPSPLECCPVTQTHEQTDPVLLTAVEGIPF